MTETSNPTLQGLITARQLKYRFDTYFTAPELCEFIKDKLGLPVAAVFTMPSTTTEIPDVSKAINTGPQLMFEGSLFLVLENGRALILTAYSYESGGGDIEAVDLSRVTTKHIPFWQIPQPSRNNI